MNDHDDLFEFEDFEDTDLDLDLEELFGDLETLAIDVTTAGQPEPVAEPVAAAPVAPVAEAAPAPQPSVRPAPAPAPAPRPVAQAPIAPEQVAALAADPGLLTPKAPMRTRLTKTTLAVGAAAIVTVANLAAMAIPHLGSPSNERPSTNEQPITAVGGDQPSAAELALLQRLEELEATLRGLDSPTAGITPTRGDYNWVIDEASAMIESEDYLGARKRLYSLLSIIDRLPTHERDRNEAAASYLLADTYKLEAQASTQEAGL